MQQHHASGGRCSRHVIFPTVMRNPLFFSQEKLGYCLALIDKQIRLGIWGVWAIIPGSGERASHSNRHRAGNANDVSSFERRASAVQVGVDDHLPKRVHKSMISRTH